MINEIKIKETFVLAVKNHQNNNFKEAENLYEEILKINPNHLESIFRLGSLSAQVKNFKKATQLLNKAIEIEPEYASAHAWLAWCYFHQVPVKQLSPNDGFPKALTAAQRAINIDENGIKLLTIKGYIPAPNTTGHALFCSALRADSTALSRNILLTLTSRSERW